MAVTEIKEDELYTGWRIIRQARKLWKKKMLIISSLTNIRIKKFSDIFQWQFTPKKKKKEKKNKKLLKCLSMLQMEILIKKFKSYTKMSQNF